MKAPIDLSLECAQRSLQAVRAFAGERGWLMAAAVTDVMGNPVALIRMDGVHWSSAAVALSKAYTAALFRSSTTAAKEHMLSFPSVAENVARLHGRPIILAGGGEPLWGGGRLIGAIGVSGGSELEDADCAVLGAAVLKDGGEE